MGLFKRKNSKFWWFKIEALGRRIQHSTGTESKRLAERIYAKALSEVQEGRWFERLDKRRTLKEMIERYRAEYSDSKDYYQKARDYTIFKFLYAYFGEDCTLEDVSAKIGGYEHSRKDKVKPATIVKDLGLLRRMFNVARKQWKWKVDNPVSDIELPKVKNERVRYLSQAEYQRLLKTLDEAENKWIRPLVLIALDTGLRLSNLCNLAWPEINLFTRMITISAAKMKNRDYIGIPLTDRALSVLKELQKVRCLSDHVFHDEGQRLYDRKVQRAFKGVLKQAGIENFRFHDLRHTFASYLCQSNVPLHTISKLMGHKDLRMTNRYSHLSVDNLRDAISTLNLKSATFPLQSEGFESGDAGASP